MSEILRATSCLAQNVKLQPQEKRTTVSTLANESVTPQRTVLLRTARVWVKGTISEYLVKLNARR